MVLAGQFCNIFLKTIRFGTESAIILDKSFVLLDEHLETVLLVETQIRERGDGIIFTSGTGVSLLNSTGGFLEAGGETGGETGRGYSMVRARGETGGENSRGS